VQEITLAQSTIKPPTARFLDVSRPGPSSVPSGRSLPPNQKNYSYNVYFQPWGSRTSCTLQHGGETVGLSFKSRLSGHCQTLPRLEAQEQTPSATALESTGRPWSGLKTGSNPHTKEFVGYSQETALHQSPCPQPSCWWQESPAATTRGSHIGKPPEFPSRAHPQ
jgi:hypothetical protein